MNDEFEKLKRGAERAAQIGMPYDDFSREVVDLKKMLDKYLSEHFASPLCGVFAVTITLADLVNRTVIDGKDAPNLFNDLINTVKRVQEWD